MTMCVLDTDVLIAALDRSDAHHRASVRGIESMLDSGIRLELSLVNYAEALVRPAEDERLAQGGDRRNCSFFASGLVAPTPAIARAAARHRSLNVSLADGFAMATAQAHDASLASFDKRVRRALRRARIELCPALR